MKKYLAVFVSILIAGAFLVGCSTNKETGKQTTLEAASTVTGTPVQNPVKADTELELKENFLKSREGHDFQIVSWKFAKACLSGDVKAMKLYLADPEKKDHFFNKENLFNEVEFLILKLAPKDIKEDSVTAEYEFGLKGKDTLQYLFLEMKRVNNAWKVESFGFEQ